MKTLSSDSTCLNSLLSDAIEYSKMYSKNKTFTVSDLPSINKTALQDEAEGKRSAQRPSVTRRLIKEVRSGAVPNVYCLVDSNRDAIKIERASAFIIVDSQIYQSLTEKVVTVEELNA